MPKVRIDVDLENIDDLDLEDEQEYVGNRRTKNNRNYGLEMDGHALNKGRKYNKRTKKRTTQASGAFDGDDSDDDDNSDDK